MRALRFTALVAAPIFFLALFVAVAALRMGYPYELEWMEGGMLEHVQRVLAGEPLYVVPSLAFVPFIYPPLYFWTAAGVAGVLGDGFLSLRAVSLISALGCFGLLFGLVRHETASWRAGLLAAGLFAATFAAGGAWLDLGRVDTLFLLWVLLGVYFLRTRPTGMGEALAACAFALAVLTKQSALVVAMPFVVLTVWQGRGWRRFIFPVTLGGLVLASMAALHLASGGWSTYYLFRLPGGHALLDSVLVTFWTADVLPALPIAALAGAYFFAVETEGRWFYAAFAAGMVGTAWLSRVHEGGYLNVLIPAFAVGAVLFALGMHALLVRMEHADPASQRLVVPLVTLAVLVQFAVLTYDPRLQLPTATDRAAADDLVAEIASVPGEVWLPYHDYLGRRAGKPAHAHAMALADVYRGDPQGEGARLRREVEAAVRSRRFGAVVLASDGSYRELVAAAYGEGEALLDDDDVLWPVTGMAARPSLLYRRSGPARSGSVE